MIQYFDVFRASESGGIPRETCEGCVCWRELGTCRQVQVLNLKTSSVHGTEAWANCCPVLFFDFIGIKLPELETAQLNEAENAGSVAE